MGTVYQVKDENIDQMFAVKVLNHTFARDRSRKKRFVQEIKALEHLDHPGIVTIYGAGEAANGLPYMIMEYIKGETLAERLKEKKALDTEEALPIFLAIAEAVENAHKSGVIHRDMKPSNIMLADQGDWPSKVKIVDFGISKVRHEGAHRTTNLTQTGEIFGSPYYMSPEQCEGVEIDKRSDIYSFGGVMYETLTGTPPFSGGNAVGIIIQHMKERPRSFDEVEPDNRVSPAIEAVVLKCLEKKPENRYQSMDEVAEALKLATDCKPATLLAEKKAEFKKLYHTSIIVMASMLTVLAFLGMLPFQFRMPEVSTYEYRQHQAYQRRIALEEKSQSIVSVQQLDESIKEAIDLTHAGLLGIDLSGKNFDGLSMPYSRYVSLSLSGATFSNCDFSRATFYQCTGRGVIFNNCKFGKSTFKGCDLSFARFNDCELSDVRKFQDKTVYDRFGNRVSVLPPEMMESRSARFESCDLSAAIFDKCWLGWTVFEKSNLSNSRFILCPRSAEQVARGARLRKCQTVGVAFN